MSPQAFLRNSLRVIFKGSFVYHSAKNTNPAEIASNSVKYDLFGSWNEKATPESNLLRIGQISVYNKPMPLKNMIHANSLPDLLPLLFHKQIELNHNFAAYI